MMLCEVQIHQPLVILELLLVENHCQAFMLYILSFCGCQTLDHFPFDCFDIIGFFELGNHF